MVLAQFPLLLYPIDPALSHFLTPHCCTQSRNTRPPLLSQVKKNTLSHVCTKKWECPPVTKTPLEVCVLSVIHSAIQIHACCWICTYERRADWLTQPCTRKSSLHLKFPLRGVIIWHVGCSENFGYCDTGEDCQKCHWSRLSQYPMIFTRRSFSLDQTTCHCSQLSH